MTVVKQILIKGTEHTVDTACQITINGEWPKVRYSGFYCICFSFSFLIQLLYENNGSQWCKMSLHS